jgi:hypothetical protein
MSYTSPYSDPPPQDSGSPPQQTQPFVRRGTATGQRASTGGVPLSSRTRDNRSVGTIAEAGNNLSFDPAASHDGGTCKCRSWDVISDDFRSTSAKWRWPEEQVVTHIQGIFAQQVDACRSGFLTPSARQKLRQSGQSSLWSLISSADSYQRSTAVFEGRLQIPTPLIMPA